VQPVASGGATSESDQWDWARIGRLGFTGPLGPPGLSVSTSNDPKATPSVRPSVSFDSVHGTLVPPCIACFR